jgi:proteasome accessory factor B
VDKLERLMNLLAALLETPRPLSAEELRERVPGYESQKEASFHRAFERDKDDLREMGIPLVVETIPGVDPPRDGYRVRPSEYYLKDPGLDPDELAALHLAASVVRIDGVHGIEGVWKLGGQAVAEGDEPVELGALPADENLVTAFAAVGQRQQVTFSYRGEERTIDPYRLDFQRGRWYLSGFDHARDEERNFRLDRIDGRADAGPPNAFRRPETDIPGVQMQPWQLGEGEPVMARILVDVDQAALARHQLGEVAEERPDGSVVVEIPVTNRDGFRSFVMSFLDHAEVLEPPELRAEIVGWLEALA